MKKYIIVLFAVLAPLYVFAQRQTQGHISAELYGGMGPSIKQYTSGIPGIDEEKVRFPSFNGGAAICFYDYSGRIVVGLDFFSHAQGYRESAIYSRPDLDLISPEFCHAYQAQVYSVYAGYMYRLWATRPRNFILSAGGYLDIGLSVCEDLGRHISPDTNYAESTSGFFLGLIPDVQMEFFPLSSASVFLSFRPHLRIVDLLSKTGDNYTNKCYTNTFHPLGCLGVKYYF